MMPSQKPGNDTPKSATAEPSVSQIVPRRTAASTPSGTATTSARASAPNVSWTVGPRRSRISAATGSPVLNERPRAPRRGRAGPAEILERQRPVEAQPLADLRGGLRGELAPDQH